SFVGEQAVAEHTGESSIVGGLGEIAGVGDQDIFNVTRMHEQADGNVHVAKLHDVAVVFGALRVESEPVAGDRAQVAEQKMPFGTGRRLESRASDGGRSCSHGVS